MFNHLDTGDAIEAEKAVYDPGSVGLRRARRAGQGGQPGCAARADDDAVSFVRGFFEQDKPTAIICTDRGC